ncbi:MAG TPA: SH3 domain-containing protein, partial [Elusimicrobiota bacterium]|nr:SH3 domain-containing protein [Elusimicrobiota bacterium]
WVVTTPALEWHDGVRVAARVEARTGPSAAERVGFLVPEGQRVAWLEASGEWVQIGLPEKGLKGWVRAEAVEPVDFRDPAPAG